MEIVTPLEAAKALAAAKLVSVGGWCCVCGGLIEEPDSYDPPLPLAEQHSPDCPVPKLPQIVVALEAASALSEAVGFLDDARSGKIEAVYAGDLEDGYWPTVRVMLLALQAALLPRAQT